MTEPTELQRTEGERFTKELETLIAESEELRINRMRQHRTRSFLTMNLGILFAIIGVGASGWFFLMEAEMTKATLALLASFVPTIFLNIWAAKPIKAYSRDHKEIFMPKLAKTIGGLSFHPKRGVSSKVIEKLAVIPAHDEYIAEDCFMGKYKGVKVIFSEARLLAQKRHDEPVFTGIFALLEIPQDVIEGHTIITSNQKMVKAFATTRWQSMAKVQVDVSEPAWDIFTIYSTEPEAAKSLVGERLLKELAEAGQIFNDAPVTAVLFGKKYIFLMIPNKENMFEASNMFVPITTKAQATKCKKEIEQLLEIIDVFDLYQPLQKN
ncbi:MAG: DUF3137 domain-containing protein [Alphaproteobacteria bacterium]|nr:DUF3137 domain-containing protein [Alphaproteobacteria bacterium]